MSRQATFQIAVGLVVLAALWLLGYVATRPPGALPRALAWAAPLVHRWRGAGETIDDGAHLSVVVVDYPDDAPLAEAIELELSSDGKPLGTLTIELDGPARQNIRHATRLARQGAWTGRGIVRPYVPVARPDDEADRSGNFSRGGTAADRLALEPVAVVFGADEPGAALLAPREAGLMVRGEFVDTLQPTVGLVGMVRRQDPAVFADGLPTDSVEAESASYRNSATYRFFVLAAPPSGPGKNGEPAFDISRNFSIIGHVVDREGLALLARLAALETGSTGRPIVPVTIDRVRPVAAPEANADPDGNAIP